MPDSINIKNTKITKEKIELGNHEFVDFLGPNAVFENCFIDIRGSARGFCLGGTTFNNCQIKTRKPLKNFRFDDVEFNNCQFEGKFIGCDFGFSPDLKQKGSYEGCDFSKATLDLCCFIEYPVETIIWPDWPGLVLLDPYCNRQDWLSISFPASFRITQETTVGCWDGPQKAEVEKREQHVRASTLYLPSHFPDFDPELLWSLVENKPYLVFSGKKEKLPSTAKQKSQTALLLKSLSKSHQQTEKIVSCYRVWGLLHRAIVVQITRDSQNFSVLLDVSFMKNKVQEAPETVKIILHNCTEFKWKDHNGSITKATEVPCRVFRVQNWKKENEGISIQSWGAKQGSLLVNYKSWEMVLPDGKPFPEKKN